jgi:hypothetical protein
MQTGIYTHFSHNYPTIANSDLQFFLAYRSLCPKAWTDRWDDQRGQYTSTYLLLELWC